MDLHNLTQVVEQAYHQVQPVVQQVVTILLNEPAHLIVEGVLLIFVLVLLCKRSYVIPKAPNSALLSSSEKEMLIKEWEPVSLIDEQQKKDTVDANLGNEDGAPMLVVHSSAGAYVSLAEGNKPDHLNLATTGYLNLQDDDEILARAEACLRTNGVGACGPRGFYGTLDVHLELEKKMATFFGTEQAVLYSSGFATITSVLPAFAKSNDYVLVDKGISFATQTGVNLARSKTLWFEHNDVAGLETHLKGLTKVFQDRVHRVFVVIEGVYFNTGDVAPLDKILELKKKYPFRIVLEESHSVGVLGKTGRGLTEHFGVPVSDVDIIAGSTGNAVGTAGGFSVGPKEATVHQRLSASGYVFSCSLPPFVAAASITAFDRIDKGVEVKALQTRIKDLGKALAAIKSLNVEFHGVAPIAHLRLLQSRGSRFEDDKLLQEIVDTVRTSKKIVILRSHYVFSEKQPPAPSIRITICSQHTAAELNSAMKAIEEVASKVLAAHKLSASASSSNKLTIHSDDEDTEEVVQPPTSPRKTRRSVAPTSPKTKAVTSPKTRSKSKKAK